MALAVKLLIGMASLAAASCGGYMVYKNVSSADKEKSKVEGDTSQKATDENSETTQNGKSPGSGSSEVTTVVQRTSSVGNG